MKIEKKVEQRKVMCVREIKTRVELCDMCYNQPITKWQLILGKRCESIFHCIQYFPYGIMVILPRLSDLLFQQFNSHVFFCSSSCHSSPSSFFCVCSVFLLAYMSCFIYNTCVFCCILMCVCLASLCLFFVQVILALFRFLNLCFSPCFAHVLLALFSSYSL